MRKVICVALVFPMVSFASDEVAVEAFNYNISTGYMKSKNTKLIDITGNIRGEIVKHVGFGLTGNIQKTDGTDNVVDQDSYKLSSQIFARDYHVGELGLSYEYLRMMPNWLTNKNWITLPPKSIDINSLGLYARYFVDKITLDVGRFATKHDVYDTKYSSNVGVGYYLTNDILVNTSLSGIDSDGFYFVGMKFQPSILKKSVSFGFSYSDSKNTDPDYAMHISYYFGTRVSLIDRDRKY